MLLKLAPGEGKTPLNIRQDEFIEELAYPCVFAGVKRDLPEDLTILKKSKFDIKVSRTLSLCIPNMNFSSIL